MNRNPLPTVDIIIEYQDGLVLIERKNPPHGWALPGGFVDYEETVEAAAQREAREETGLIITDLDQFRVYSAADRDPRQHTVTTVFTARGTGALQGADDARQARVFPPDQLPEPMAFDHRRIIHDYLKTKKRKLFNFSMESNRGEDEKGIAIPLEARKTSVQGQLLKDTGALRKYRDIFIGRSGLMSFLKYELITFLFSSLQGSIGFFLRKVFYPLLFKKVGKGVAFGRHLTIRHPHKIEIGDRVFIDDFVVLDAKGEQNQGIRIGDQCFIGRNTVLSCKEGDIRIDSNSSISNNCSLLSESEIRIGAYTYIAGHCYLVAGGNHGYEDLDVPILLQKSVDRGGIELAGNNWLGAGVQVLDGCRIEYGSIIGAGSTVYKSIEKNSIAVGVPAMVTKRRG